MPGSVKLFSEITSRIRTGILLIFFLVPLSGCWVKGTGDVGVAFKRITPKMERQMEYLLKKGCDEEYQYLDPDIAMLYSILPGGGQFYAGERKRGMRYLMSSPFVVPYFISFKDAQNSVDYYNFKYKIQFFAKKLGLTRKKTEQNVVIQKMPRRRSRK